MIKSYPMSEQGRETLKEELIYLKEVEEKEIKDEIKKHHSFCDFSENASFDQMLDEQALLKKRINEIQDILAYAEIIQPKAIDDPRIQLGDTVYFRELPDGPKEKYTLVGPTESNPFAHKLSIESPIGQALLGKELGEKLEIDLAAGERIIEILAIE